MGHLSIFLLGLIDIAISFGHTCKIKNFYYQMIIKVQNYLDGWYTSLNFVRKVACKGTLQNSSINQMKILEHEKPPCSVVNYTMSSRISQETSDDVDMAWASTLS